MTAHLDRIVSGFAELTLETDRHRSISFADPAGNVVEAWDFFEHGRGSAAGVDGLR